MRILLVLISLLIFAVAIGCKSDISNQEIVMTKGMEITATTGEGTIKILAAEGFERIYMWNDCIRKVEHWPRKQRWYGSKGIYFPGPGFHWKDCNGVKRAVVEEGQQHFDTNDEALEWIKKRRYMDYVYTHNGLMVGWHIEEHTLSCEVWQIMVKGEKPEELEGCEDEKIQITFLAEEDVDTYSNGIDEEDKYVSDEIIALEKRIEKDPRDFEARAILLEQYFLQVETSKDAREKWKRNVLWIVRNDRYSENAAFPLPFFDPEQQKKEIELAIDLWHEIVKEHSEDALILSTAARFLMLYESLDIAEGLLKRAQDLEPKNPDWMEELAGVYILRAARESGKQKEILLKEAANEREKAKKLVEGEVFYKLCDLAKETFESGNMRNAREYANQLLEEAEARENDWNYGNAIHDGNMVLGRIALRSGDINSAKEYLLKAGATPGSVNINAFGPNMLLAKDLLEKGEKDVVLEYLARCRNIWEIDLGKLDKWIEQVKKGEIPDFESNLDN
jgi:hypothetical protein